MTSARSDPAAAEAARCLGPAWQGVEAAAVLGSGLGEAARGWALEAEVGYGELPGFGGCAAPGHHGRLARCRVAGHRVAVFRGRRHFYETGSMAAAAWPARLAAALGARCLVLLSAVGGVSAQLGVGSWVFVEDHLNWMGRNPLEGVVTAEGPAFVDLTRTYRTDLFESVRDRLARRGVLLERGVLGAFAGPTYETPAEVRMARLLGAAVVGMSTVPEAVWGRFLGLEVLAYGRVANPAAGVTGEPLCHGDVVEESRRGGGEAAAVVEESVAAWARGGCGGR